MEQDCVPAEGSVICATGSANVDRLHFELHRAQARSKTRTQSQVEMSVPGSGTNRKKEDPLG